MATEKSWQARISEATDALAQEFVESISYDRRLYKQDIAGSIAHATMLAHVGLISEQERDQVIAALHEIRREIESGAFHFDPSLEDIHMAIEAALIRKTEAGRKLHTGRSRNDQVALDLRLWITDAAEELGKACGRMIRALVDLAERSREIVMPAFTHLQRAQPISAAAEALAWATAIERGGDRLVLLCRSLSDVNPLGSGAIAGSSLPLDRDLTSKLLIDKGFARAPWTASQNSIDATASRDAAVDFVYACAMLAMTLSRFAEQWILYLSTEFSFLRIADRYTTGSSMMPQKRNPDMLELIRGRCGNIYGNLVALLTILKGLPIGYNRDLQEDKRHVFAAFDTIKASLTMASAIVASAEFVPEKIEAALDRGFLDATSLAEYLVGKGVPFRTAHQIVGALVAKCDREGKTSLSQLSPGQMQAEAQGAHGGIAIGEDVREWLGARNVVNRYATAGAAGGKPLEEQLKQWQQRLRELD
ncbi:MAG TPA: argininosuccinate lyase [Tepidisphaeraceae bacterium]|nr:argininosuccinate lyase [Tepidisphaeraceae bacterium]